MQNLGSGLLRDARRIAPKRPESANGSLAFAEADTVTEYRAPGQAALVNERQARS
jgi:hypothetical protein